MFTSNQIINFKKKFVYEFKNPPENEQKLIGSFFYNKPDGYYVDVGANEPVKESQTYHLEKLGWEGLLIEALPYYANLLRKKRNGKVIQCAVSSPKNQNKKLKFIVAGGHSTLNENPIALGDFSNKTTTVICRTLDTILKDNKASTNFEFISIDIEGHELEMFKGFNLKKWKPKLVLLEDHVTNHKKHEFMKNNGYQVILRTGLNSWYVPVDAGYKLSLFARLEFFRKYYIGLLSRKFRYRK
jgi:FkbM family methyltransferase